MLLAVPKYGRVKVNKILQQCRISPSKTIGGLSERQRTELVGLLRQLGLVPARAGGARLRHHRPLGGRQGHADPRPARAPAGARAVASRPPRARRARASRTASTTTSSPTRSSSAASRQATSSSTPSTPAAATARCARSSSAARRPAARSCSRSRSRARARCATTMPEAVQVFIAPAVARGAAHAPDRARHRRRRAGRARACASPSRSWRRRASSATWSSTTASRRPSSELAGIVAGALARSRQVGIERGCKRAVIVRAAGTLGRMITPRIDSLLEHVDSNYASRPRRRQARAPDQLATTTTSARAPSTSSRRRWSRPSSKNYLTIALEEVAAGKIKYQYR